MYEEHIERKKMPNTVKL